MDIIDRLIFTSIFPVGRSGVLNPMNPILAAGNYDNIYADIPNQFILAPLTPSGAPGNFFYPKNVRNRFCTIEDTGFLENAMQKHWFDVVNRRVYINPLPVGIQYDLPFDLPPYHLIYSYLLENTRMAQIFEKLIFMYQTDEKLTKASDAASFQWMMNTDALFFKDSPSNATRFYTGYLRPSPEAVRRNAYHRLFGLDLAFGDIKNDKAKYQKAEFTNSSFILLFESFLREFWQAFTNARNTSGANTTDYFSLTDTAEKIQEMLMSRRSMVNNFNDYKHFNLSREEYGSVLFMSWLYESVSYNSPLVEYLRCTGNTPGERLINIGLKVGIPAHSKSELIFEMAPPLATLLRMIEAGLFNPSQIANVSAIIMALVPPGGTAVQIQQLNSILLIINNWERVTGHRIKTLETPVVGNVRLVNLPPVKPRV